MKTSNILVEIISVSPNTTHFRLREIRKKYCRIIIPSDKNCKSRWQILEIPACDMASVLIQAVKTKNFTDHQFTTQMVWTCVSINFRRSSNEFASKKDFPAWVISTKLLFWQASQFYYMYSLINKFNISFDF